ncbi:uncharacterized protein LOC141881690 isoform X1 [Acropora palmata]|uniref:uncharacterized protein LOC141881690 isoform X1 n=2 Tax=Acropora palmata TaxID=6131 RepID=UPI003DA05C8D
MADILLGIRSTCKFCVFSPSYRRLGRNARHLTLLKEIFYRPQGNSNVKEKFQDAPKASCFRVSLRRMSSKAAAISSQVVSTESTEVEKSKKYQQLHVMPFSVMQGGKYVAHVLFKYKPRRSIVFVRTKVLAEELKKELAEYGLDCTYPSKRGTMSFGMEHIEKENISKSDAEDVNTVEEGFNQNITVMTEGEVEAMESVLPVDLFLIVQQPMTGKSFVLFCLKKTHTKGHPLDVVLLYSQNELALLSQLETHVDVKKLPPPSFHNVPTMTEGLPSLPGESMDVAGRHLIEPPPPSITARLPQKRPLSQVFQPPVPVPTKQSERHRFSDRVRIYVRGGTGGQGSSYFGGLGGDGGDVVVQCSPNASLDHFAVKENRRILAEHGTYFSGKRGKRRRVMRGRDTVIPVPIGTTLSTDEGKIIGELDELGSRILVAQGGRGGCPDTEDWNGEKGERRMIRLEMRLIADIALVGFPNAGKSSLLRAISQATPKAADYAFTTMRPNIGMVEYPDHSQVSVADLPGLIEGASVNRGLGHSFLKHTQKARALALVVDIDGFHLSDKFPARTPLQNVFILLKELVLYDKELLRRPKMLVVTKLDKKGATNRFHELRQKLLSIEHGNLLPVLEEIRTSSPVTQEKTNLMSLADELSTIRFDSVIPVSAATSFGLDDLRDKMKTIL